MADAAQRKIDSILVWKLDRFGHSLRDLDKIDSSTTKSEEKTMNNSPSNGTPLITQDSDEKHKQMRKTYKAVEVSAPGTLRVVERTPISFIPHDKCDPEMERLSHLGG